MQQAAGIEGVAVTNASEQSQQSREATALCLSMQQDQQDNSHWIEDTTTRASAEGTPYRPPVLSRLGTLKQVAAEGSKIHQLKKRLSSN